MGKRTTSGYTIVVHEVTTTSVKLWIGALSPSMGKPKNWQLVVKKADTAKQRKNEVGDVISTESYDDEWVRPFDKLNKRFYTIKTLQNLEPDVHYIIEFQVRSEQEWKVLEKVFVTTFPERLPDINKKPFTVGIGSCFYTEHDGGDAGQAYEALYNNEKLRPDIKFLMGDQVYADIGLGWYPLDESDCQDRIADHYADSWKYLRSILRRGGSWMISDDHEFWNNFPFYEGFNPYLITLKHNASFRERWHNAAQIGVSVIQQVLPVRTFDIGNDISFCVADLRMERTESGFLSAQSHEQLIAWINNLSTPGVLAIPQPLIADKGDNIDKNLPYWDDQYNDILLSIEKGNHDIVVLTGDVHYGRVSQVIVGNSNNRLTEIITSPMSNLSEINGIAANGPDMSAEKFPIESVDGMVKNDINHIAKVTTESKWWDLRYPVERTHEHFMTVEFYRVDNKVKMNVNAWHAREMDKRTGLPKKIKDFKLAPIVLT